MDRGKVLRLLRVYLQRTRSHAGLRHGCCGSTTCRVSLESFARLLRYHGCLDQVTPLDVWKPHSELATAFTTQSFTAVSVIWNLHEINCWRTAT